MDIRRFIPILIGVVLISFGIGIYSLRYYDNITFDRFKHNGVNTNDKGLLNVKSNGSNVVIGKEGIQVKDGDEFVSISWDGINVKDGDEQVSVGWNGIKVKDGEKEVRGMANLGGWFGITTKNLDNHIIDEEKHENIDGITSIKVASSFIDIKVLQENRDDVLIKYYGSMKSNVVPKLETERNGSELNIKLTSNKNSYTVSESNVVLEVIIPTTYDKDINVTSSSADIFINDFVGKDFKIASSSGDIDINNVKGKNVNITTSSGDMSLDKLESHVNLTSSSGDIELFVNKSTEDVKIVTSSGDVNVSFDEGANYNVFGTTSSGDVRSSRLISVNKDKNSKFEFSVGNGGKEMRITTSSGDVFFK